MQPDESPTPILFSETNPDGVLLEEILPRLVEELQAKMKAEPCRETALVITKLEEALHWQIARGLRLGTARLSIMDPRT